MSVHKRIKAGILVLFAVTGLLNEAWAGPSIVEIQRAWTRREHDSPTGRIVWSEQILDPKGTRGSFRDTEDSQEYPLEDTTYPAHRTLIWSGDAMKYESERKLFNHNLKAYLDSSYKTVSGGDGTRTLDTGGGSEYPRGRLGASQYIEARQDVELLPVLYWIRPLSTQGSEIKLADCRLLPETRAVEGRACVVLQRRRNGAIDEWSVDTERDYLILRYDLTVEAKPRIRMDLGYKQGDDAGWQLAGWKTVVYRGNSGKLALQIDADVMTCELNAKIEESDLALEFPPGTWVNDNIRKVNYILRSDGTERVVTKAEMRKPDVTYKDIVTTETGLAGTSAPRTWRQWMLIVAALGLAVALVINVTSRVRAWKQSRSEGRA